MFITAIFYTVSIEGNQKYKLIMIHKSDFAFTTQPNTLKGWGMGALVS